MALTNIRLLFTRDLQLALKKLMHQVPRETRHVFQLIWLYNVSLYLTYLKCFIFCLQRVSTSSRNTSIVSKTPGYNISKYSKPKPVTLFNLLDHVVTYLFIFYINDLVASITIIVVLYEFLSRLPNAMSVAYQKILDLEWYIHLLFIFLLIYVFFLLKMP